MGDLYNIVIYEKIPCSLRERVLGLFGVVERGICLKKQGMPLCPEGSKVVNSYGYFSGKQLDEMLKYFGERYGVSHIRPATIVKS